MVEDMVFIPRHLVVSYSLDGKIDGKKLRTSSSGWLGIFAGDIRLRLIRNARLFGERMGMVRLSVHVEGNGHIGNRPLIRTDRGILKFRYMYDSSYLKKPVAMLDKAVHDVFHELGVKVRRLTDGRE